MIHYSLHKIHIHRIDFIAIKRKNVRNKNTKNEFGTKTNPHKAFSNMKLLLSILTLLTKH